MGSEMCIRDSPATMTHRGMEAKARDIAGIKDTLIRISVGLEDINDLTTDLKDAISHI